MMTRYSIDGYLSTAALGGCPVASAEMPSAMSVRIQRRKYTEEDTMRICSLRSRSATGWSDSHTRPRGKNDSNAIQFSSERVTRLFPCSLINEGRFVTADWSIKHSPALLRLH